MGKAELEKKVAALLTEAKLTVAVAESCTGGLLGHRLTSVPGSSEYFVGGVIAYSNEIKNKILGVGLDVLRKEGAVSDTVARLMAIAIRGRFGADLGMAVTGVAGPGGGSEEKPVGLVWVALSGDKGCRVRRLDLSGKRRAAVKTGSSAAALEMIVEYLK